MHVQAEKTKTAASTSEGFFEMFLGSLGYSLLRPACNTLDAVRGINPARDDEAEALGRDFHRREAKMARIFRLPALSRICS